MPYRTLLGLGLLSGGGLLLEIELTRLFSFIYYPPYVYALLALAVLGVGVGAALATGWVRLRRRALLPVYAALATVTTLIVTAVVLRLPQPSLQALHLILAVLPFVALGLALATLFSSASDQSPRLYAADLGGAGLGALLAVPLIDGLQLPLALLVTAALFSLAALLWDDGARLAGWAPLALSLTLLAGTVWGGWLTLDLARLSGEKPLVAQLAAGAVVIDSKWDAVARTDLIDPGDGRPYELYMDGAAGSVMPPAAGHPALWRDIGLFPFATEQPQRVFVIGPGGGLDVWFGLQSNAAQIDGVEVNRASVDMVAQQADYNGNLYDQPNVQIWVDEGRSVLARADAEYDLIFLAHVVTLAAERGGLALVENSAFTVEAFADYLDHLSPDGMLAIKLYDEPTLSRALGTALAVLNDRGLSDADALRHVITLLDGRTDPPIPLLMVRNSPFSRDDALSLGAVAREVGFSPLFLPEVLAQPPLDGVAAGEESFASVIAASPNNLAPVTDNRPFFYQFEPGLPAALTNLLVGLLALVGIGGVATALYTRRVTAVGALRRSPLYFAALGAGFMLVEIGLIQQTRLLLGHPSITLAAVLGVLLIGGGLGSLLFGRLASTRVRYPVRVALGGVIVLTVLWALGWLPLQEAAMGTAFSWRLLLAGGAILPLALCMGAPFPLGLQYVGHGEPRLVPLAWAVNGVLSVAGAAAGLALAMLFGYQVVLLAGAAVYGVAFLVKIEG